MVLAFNVIEGGEILSEESEYCRILSSGSAELDLGDVPGEGNGYEAKEVYGHVSGTRVVLWQA